ncbi:OB-fold domain-containing protein, partial [Mycobacterium malmoense]|uniref:OB-fold domain-containing protein n=1 Tax=Mycobacterium malmoense TaxID=1780 RepID=UPI002100631F
LQDVIRLAAAQQVAVIHRLHRRYPAPDPFEPFAIAAVELAEEGLIVLGKVVEGTLADDLKVGMEMELTTMPLFTDDDGVQRIVHAWRIAK